jgi:hypothetical protein
VLQLLLLLVLASYFLLSELSSSCRSAILFFTTPPEQSESLTLTPLSSKRLCSLVRSTTSWKRGTGSLVIDRSGSPQQHVGMPSTHLQSSSQAARASLRGWRGRRWLRGLCAVAARRSAQPCPVLQRQLYPYKSQEGEDVDREPAAPPLAVTTNDNKRGKKMR